MIADCTDFRDVAAELALDLTTGAERAEALAHVADCPTCRAELVALTDAAEQLLFLAPRVAPDPGFDEWVVATLTADADDPSSDHTRRPARRRHRRLATFLTAAVIVIAVVIAALAWPSTSGAPSSIAAVMRTGRGDAVGRVVLRDGHPTRVVMDIPAWDQLARRYRVAPGSTHVLAITRRDGGRNLIPLADNRAWAWNLPVRAPASAIESVAVTDGHGLTWCQATFPA